MTEPNLAEHLASLFERVRSLYTSPAFTELIHLNLSFSHLKTLRHVADNGAVSMKALAEVLHMTPPSVTALVRRLEQTGLLERVRHSSDSRVWLVRLTDQGTTLMVTLRRQRIQLMQQLLDTLHPDEQHSLLDLLECAVTTAEDLIKTSDGQCRTPDAGSHPEDPGGRVDDN